MRAGVRISVVLAVAGVMGCRAAPQPEPVRFAAVSFEPFAASGTLTDAWADYDGDGDPDRFVGFNGAPARLYRNDGAGAFVDVASTVGLAVERSVRTSAWGDFDADGDPDLLLGYAGDAPVTELYRNDGPDGFVEVAAEVGLRLERGTTRQASWVDFDGDGDLDLSIGMRDRANHLFRNSPGPGGLPSFEDVALAMAFHDPRRTVGALWADFDRDGDLDFLMANMNGDANALFLNEGDGFRDVATATVLSTGGRALGDDAQGSVRPCAVDHDSDGLLDVFFANYGPNELVRSTADGAWQAMGAPLGLAIDGRYDTCAWGDFDHDGTVDLYVNGTVTGGVQYRDYLFRREAADAFVDVTPPELLGLAADHGATWVDFDLDGDLDLALTGVADDGMHHLMQNLLRPEFAWHSLQVRVVDENGAATKAGAEVRVYVAGTERLLGTRLVDTGSGYDAQSDLPVHFGLPGAQPVDVVVTWPARGRRHGTRVDGVDPAQHRGGALTVRVGSGG